MQKRSKRCILLQNIVFLFLFFSVSSAYSTNENTMAAILEQTKQCLKNECEKNDDTYKVIHFVDSLADLSHFSEQDFMKAINRIGEIFRRQGKLVPAIELYLNTISYFHQIPNPDSEQLKNLVLCYIPLGASHEELGLWNRALDFYYEALNIAEENKFEIQEAMIYNNIGAILYNRNEMEKAKFYLLKAIEINKKFEIKQELFNNYNNLGGIYINRKEYDQALECALLAIQQLEHDKNAFLYYFMQSNIASIYLQKKDYKLAFSFLTNAMEHQSESGFASDLAQTYAYFSYYYEMTGMRDSSEMYMEKALQQARLVGNKHTESQFLQNLAAYYERNQDALKAYQALKESTAIGDSILMIDNQQKMSDLERMYIAEKKIRENELLIKNITLQKLTSDRLWIISASITLLLIFVVLFLIHYSKNKEKARKNEELLLQHQKELHEKEKELQKQKELDLNDTIDRKNRELTSYTLYMIKNNEFISDMKDELKRLLLELNPKDRVNREHIRQLLNKLSQQNATDNWEEFSYYFEKVHPSFYANLEKHYPDLTIKEKRLCAFLRLGLSSKEISSITFKEVRSVESARNRLRKKLGINQEDNLTEFLQNSAINQI